jgi:membrane protease YdiL (CAAX protease family)
MINAWIFTALFPTIQGNGKSIQNIYERFIVTCIAAPLIETYLIQVLLLKESINYLKLNKHFAVIISSLIFGSLHYQHWAYISKTFIDGLLLGYLYVSFLPNFNKAFFYVAIVHAIYNLIALLS